MKKVLLLAAVLLSGCATHKQSVVDTRPAIASITHADATIKKIANAKPKEIAPLVKEADDELEQAEAQVQQVQKQADAVQNERDWWKADDASKDKQIVTLESKVSHWHHLISIISGFLAVSVAFTTWRLSVISPWIPIGLTLATYGISWLLLGRI